MTHSVEIVIDNGLARLKTPSLHRDDNRYVITTDGIDTYEETLPPSKLTLKRQERREILEKLRIEYDKDPQRFEPSDDILIIIHWVL